MAGVAGKVLVDDIGTVEFGGYEVIVVINVTASYHIRGF